MSGTWETQNKILPGAYINVRTNEPLSISPGERGKVVLLSELEGGADKELYVMTATENNLPDAVTADGKRLMVEALKNANTVFVYTLPPGHTQEDVEEALEIIRTSAWDVLCYPYDGEAEATVKTLIASYIKAMRDGEGIKCQAVLANYKGDHEGIIDVVQGITLSGGRTLTAAEVTAWVAGATAGAGMTVSNTGRTYDNAVDVSPRMTRTEMEVAITAGKFIFKVDAVQNVTVVYDINSLTTFTAEKGKMFCKNRVVRTVDNIVNDITKIFEGGYIGKVNNNSEGRTLLKASLTDYFNTLLTLGAIQNFETDDVSVTAGNATDAVVVDAHIQPVDSVEKIYITVNLS